jgi:endonuclease/exonuclease/phosphatase family metal-dependent hydrolase
MRLRLFVLCAFWCCFAASTASAESLTIATYNLENYGAADRMTPDGYRTNYPKPETQKSALRKVIKALNADVLVVQEVGPRAYLLELQRDLRREGVDYSYVELVEAGDDERHVGILSRRALAEVVRHTELRFRYFGASEQVKRGLLEVRIDTRAGPVTIFGVHLKSRFTDRADDPMSGSRRTGEATAIRDAILQRFPNPAKERFVVLGDFNDEKASKPLQRFLQRGETKIAELLAAADSRGETWTHHYAKVDAYSRVDHVLVSAALKSAVHNGSATIFDGPDVLDASDHRPVLVRLEFKPE